MASPSLGPYERVAFHEAVSGIIRRHSTHPDDVRRVALDGLDLSGVRDVLDLGCGFGFLAEELAPRLAPDARLVGVDNWCSNEEPFLRRVEAAGRRASFRCLHVEESLPCPDRSFDLVVCTYALYFFAKALGDIVRVLRPGGLFLVVTHSERLVAGELEKGGFVTEAARLRELIRGFSAENGEAALRERFESVGCIEYRNALRFGTDDVDELLTYLQFKLPLLYPGKEPDDALPFELDAFARRLLAENGEVTFDKSDAIFRCRGPRCP